MVTFDSLKVNDGVCSIPVVSGVLVFWSAGGSCVRISASYDSLGSVVRECREWLMASPFRESVAFWSGSVCVCRVSLSSLYAPFVGVVA